MIWSNFANATIFSNDAPTGALPNILLKLLRRIINSGICQRHCPALDWVITLPKQDPNTEYFEILSPEQFHQLQYGNLIQTAKFSFYISLLVGRVQGPQKHLNCTGRMLIVSGKLHPA